ncbi:MAG: hypothetical protein EBT79_01205 [Actinobacteria bacterium]|nr:hypothetical protein [Actinomycetota bacterium]
MAGAFDDIATYVDRSLPRHAAAFSIWILCSAPGTNADSRGTVICWRTPFVEPVTRPVVAMGRPMLDMSVTRTHNWSAVVVSVAGTSAPMVRLSSTISTVLIFLLTAVNTCRSPVFIVALRLLFTVRSTGWVPQMQ